MLEPVIGLSRRTLTTRSLLEWCREPLPLKDALDALAANQFASRRFEGALRRAVVGLNEPLPVHIIVSQLDHSHSRMLVEMIEIEQQTRQGREERVAGQAQVTKELIRNLAHEIKNPLGGIRGAAPPLVLAEHPRGLSVVRDYDASIPEFRGDREQLIQAVLNIVHNACQALSERIEQGDAEIILRTRVGRQVTIGKQRWRLALELHIQDNGPGVPESLRDRIFYPLVSGREGGSGLGLTLAQTFVQQHQGTIECDSEPGRTVFKIVIPLP